MKLELNLVNFISSEQVVLRDVKKAENGYWNYWTVFSVLPFECAVLAPEIIEGNHMPLQG